MVTCLLTGGSGFIGQALVEKLLENAETRVVVSSRAAVNGGHTRLLCIQFGPLETKTDWSSALRGVDVVFHCAAVTPGGTDNPPQMSQVNRDGTLNLARQAAEAGVRRFVFVSSAQVNGDATHGGSFSETSKSDPRSPYAISKWETEQGLAELSQDSGMPVTVVRPPLVYGRGVKGNLAQLAKLAGLGIRCPWPPSATGSLIAVDNLTDFLRHCSTHAAAGNETYLISDSRDLATGGYSSANCPRPQSQGSALCVSHRCDEERVEDSGRGWNC